MAAPILGHAFLHTGDHHPANQSWYVFQHRELIKRRGPNFLRTPLQSSRPRLPCGAFEAFENPKMQDRRLSRWDASGKLSGLAGETVALNLR